MKNPTMKSPHAAGRPKCDAPAEPHNSSSPLVKFEKKLKEAILSVMAYVKHATGTEPGQEEIAAVLKSYFTLDEVTNQISYLQKRPPEDETDGGDSSSRPLTLRINLMSGPAKNSLARAGLFSRPIAEGIARIRKHAEAVLGAALSDEHIARSLKSSFILSELKNQIVHARKHSRKPPG
jgi:hypothetical protein